MKYVREVVKKRFIKKKKFQLTFLFLVVEPPSSMSLLFIVHNNKRKSFHSSFAVLIQLFSVRKIVFSVKTSYEQGTEKFNFA